MNFDDFIDEQIASNAIKRIQDTFMATWMKFTVTSIAESLKFLNLHISMGFDVITISGIKIVVTHTGIIKVGDIEYPGLNWVYAVQRVIDSLILENKGIEIDNSSPFAIYANSLLEKKKRLKEKEDDEERITKEDMAKMCNSFPVNKFPGLSIEMSGDRLIFSRSNRRWSIRFFNKKFQFGAGSYDKLDDAVKDLILSILRLE